MTFAELFFSTARRHGSRPFLVDASGSRSYESFARDVRRAAGKLRREGVTTGERVAVLMHNHPAFVAVWFALASLGAVAVAINTELRGTTLSDVLGDSGARRLILDDDLATVVREAMGSDFGQYELQGIASPDDFFRELASLPELGDLPAVDDCAPCTILYSSGTTSRPKGAISSHRSYVLAGRDMSAGLAIRPEDRFYVFLPLYHANPQFYAVASAVHSGASISLARRFSARGFWQDVARYAPTLFTYVGSVLPILATLEVPAHHTLRACVGGGVTPELWASIEERWSIRICELYGMTETAGFATINGYDERRRGTVGRARPALDVRILDGDVPVGPGLVGEIVIRPRIPHAIFDGYLGMSADETFGSNGFRTGDLGSVDADGYYRYVGRVKEMIRVRGENIAPAYLEGLLRDCPLLLEVAVVGVPSERGDEDLKLCGVPSKGATHEDVSAWCAQHLPRFMQPRYIEFRKDLPKTSTMKILRRDLVQPSEGAVTWQARH